ncbi:hypothetical protein ACM26W_08780 [Halomonas sp. HK25]|uniref:hypothetical protein n=1 Tax=Halomonas sp. HK25 TaxID=3394321 RepID=UPI0039FD1B93
MVDVGNAGPRKPIPLEAGVEVRHGRWEYRLERSPLLRYRRHDGWFNLYQFSDERFYAQLPLSRRSAAGASPAASPRSLPGGRRASGRAGRRRR